MTPRADAKKKPAMRPAEKKELYALDYSALPPPNDSKACKASVAVIRDGPPPM